MGLISVTTLCIVGTVASVVSAAQASSSTPVILQALEMLKGADDVVGRMARLGGIGGGLTILLPIFLCIGFFAFIIPFFAILFLGATTFSGSGGQGWGGAAGLYPAGRKVADLLVPGLPLSNEQLVQAMTFLDKAFTEFGSKMLTPSSKTAGGKAKSVTPKKKTGPQAKFRDEGRQGYERQIQQQLPSPSVYSTTTSTTTSPRPEMRTVE